MKALFAILVSSLFTIASLAADRRPTVTINGNRNYEIVIDGRRYDADNTINISHLRKGSHSIRVYEVSRGIFRSKSRLVSSSTFNLWNDDLYINIDRYGSVRVREARYGNDRDYRRDDNDWKRDRDWDDRNDRNDRNNKNDRRY